MREGCRKISCSDIFGHIKRWSRRERTTISSAAISHYTYPYHHIPKCSVVIVAVAVFVNVVAAVVFGVGPVMVVIVVIVVVVVVFVNVVVVVFFGVGRPPNGLMSLCHPPNG